MPKQIDRWEDHMEGGRERREDKIVRCSCTGAGPDRECRITPYFGAHPRECYMDDGGTLRFADGRAVMDRYSAPVSSGPPPTRPAGTARDHLANAVMIAKSILSGHGGKALYTDPEDAHTLAQAVLAFAQAARGGTPAAPDGDWTRGPDGRSNTSQAYEAAVDTVRRLLVSGAAGSVLSKAWVDDVAAFIVAQLAHVHGFAPRSAP